MPERKPCRCLLMEAAPTLAESVQEYIRLLDESVKAPEEVYRKRLSICLSCVNLRDGTCGLCGCYVEARAAKRGNRCASVPPLWDCMPAVTTDDDAHVLSRL